MSPEDIAIRNFFESHLFRLSELVYGKYVRDREYPFYLLLSKVRTLVKACEEFGLDDIDWLAKVAPLFAVSFAIRLRRHVIPHVGHREKFVP